MDRLSFPERSTRGLFTLSGALYGVFFGLGFAFFTWGLDTIALLSTNAALPWVRLALGLPLSVLICGLAGWFGAMFTSTVLTVLIWVVAVGLLSVVAGHIPFEGSNLILWLVDSRLSGETVFSFGSSAQLRTTWVVILNVLLGAFAGLIQSLAVQWAWDRGSPSGKLSWRSWVVLLVAVPVSFLPTLAVNGYINRPFRAPQEYVGRIVEMSLSGESLESNNELLQASFRSVKPYLQSFTDEYKSHFVSFGSETGSWHSAYVDVVFENGFAMRCVTSGEVVIYCDDFSKRLSGWVEDLIYAGLYGEQPWLEGKVKRLIVDESVVAWLEAHQEELSENYGMIWDPQTGGWNFVRISFDTGFEMVCRFRDAQPVLVDQCKEASP